MDERATKVKAKEKLHTVMNKIGYPDKWRDYFKLEIVRGDALGTQCGCTSLKQHATWPRWQAGGQGRVDDDAAHGQRLLRSAE